MLALSSQIFEYLGETFYRDAFKSWVIGSFKKPQNNRKSSYGNALLFVTFLRACGWSEHIVAARASPRT